MPDYYMYGVLALACIAAIVYSIFSKDTVDADLNAPGFSFTLRAKGTTRRRKRPPRLPRLPRES